MPTPSTLEVLAPATAATGDLVAQINAHHLQAQDQAAQAQALGRSAVGHAILAGLQLARLKEITPHGQWEALFASGQKRVGKANATHVSHLNFDSQTARRYIAVASQIVTQKLQPEQSAALMALANGAPVDDSAAQLLDEITPAKTLRQTYLELGIVKPTPKEAAWLGAEPAAQSDAAGEGDAPSPVARLKSAAAAARRDWFGESRPGHCAPGSPAALLETELHTPARGSLRLLGKADLEILSDYFRRAAKAASALAQEK